MVPYFSKFPTVLYTFDEGNTNQLLTNIIHRSRIREIVQTNTAVYYQYQVKDEETAWQVAAKYYGDSRWFWVVLMTNNIIDPYYDWPMGYTDFIAFIIKQYGDIQTAYQTTHHYEDINGNWIDYITYIQSTGALGNTLLNTFLEGGDTPGSNEYNTAISAYEYYYNLNESKRTIQLLDKKYLSQIDSELDAILGSS